MPITARSIGGAGLMGLGDALQAYAQQGIRRRDIADQWRFELAKQAITAENKREDAATAAGIKRADAATAARQGLLKDVIEHPENAAARVQMASLDSALQGVDLDEIRNAAKTMGTQHVLQSINQAKDTESMGADIGQRLSAATGQDYGSLPLQPQIDLAHFGGEQPQYAAGPTLDRTLATALARESQLRAAKQREIELAGQKKQTEETGTLTAKNLNAPTELANDLTRKRAMIPLEGESAGVVAAAQGAAADTPERIAAAARRAAATTAATESAKAPYGTPTILTDASTGEAKAVRFVPGPNGTQIAQPVDLPAGMAKTAPKGLGIAERDRVSMLNVAEVETVKILKALHDSGLDSSKSLADPRWRQFLMTTLKVQPKDVTAASMTQRVNAVQAMLLKQLLGGRPSEYLAQLYLPHLPNAEMTGELLAHNLKNVMEQTRELRGEIERGAGQRPGSQDPTTGMSYKQYLDSLQQEAAAPAVAPGSTLKKLLGQQRTNADG